MGRGNLRSESSPGRLPAAAQADFLRVTSAKASVSLLLLNAAGGIPLPVALLLSLSR